MKMLEEERTDGDVYIDLGGDDEDTQSQTTDNSSDGQSDSGNQVGNVDSKWDGKSKEDVLLSYKALEKKLGEQGKELGDLRKGYTPPVKDKGSKTLGNISNRISELEEKIYSDDFDRFDEEDKKLQKEYDKLNREFGVLSAEEKYNHNLAQRENVKAVEKFTQKFSELSESEMEVVKDFAVNRLSENGLITEADLEASLMRNDPARYKKFMEISVKTNERDRIQNAHKNKQPRMSASGQTNKRVNISEMLRNNPDKAKGLLKKLSLSQLKKLSK
jgi:hypothetical protein